MMVIRNMYAVLSAEKNELQPLINHARINMEANFFGHKSYLGDIDYKNVLLATTGLGNIRAAIATQYIIDKYAPCKMIFVGFAGAINPDLCIGDTIISQKIIKHDYNSTGSDDVMQSGAEWINADACMVDAALRVSKTVLQGNKISIGNILSGDQAILSKQKKECLWNTFRGDCVEMEGGGFAMTCSLNSIPFVLVRTISDYADEKAINDFSNSYYGFYPVAAFVAIEMIKIMDKSSV